VVGDIVRPRSWQTVTNSSCSQGASGSTGSFDFPDGKRPNFPSGLNILTAESFRADNSPDAIWLESWMVSGRHRNKYSLE